MAPADPLRATVVGISAGELTVTHGLWKERAASVPAAYVHALARAGATPVVIPPAPGAAEALIERIDALVLTGGPDLDPARYGEERHPRSQPPDRARDDLEFALLDAAAERDLPVLGICRGIQVLNVWRGGTLHQHLPDVVRHRGHMAVPGSFGDHPVRVQPGSRLAAMLGRGELEAPGHHHQAVDRLGSGLEATAWAHDGTIEGVEDPARRFVVAVQWHPEVGEDPSLFDALVAASSVPPAEAPGGPGRRTAGGLGRRYDRRDPPATPDRGGPSGVMPSDRGAEPLEALRQDARGRRPVL